MEKLLAHDMIRRPTWAACFPNGEPKNESSSASFLLGWPFSIINANKTKRISKVRIGLRTRGASLTSSSQAKQGQAKHMQHHIVLLAESEHTRWIMHLFGQLH